MESVKHGKSKIWKEQSTGRAKSSLIDDEPSDITTSVRIMPVSNRSIQSPEGTSIRSVGPTKQSLTWNLDSDVGPNATPVGIALSVAQSAENDGQRHAK
jgi:hypothetical protein